MPLAVRARRRCRALPGPAAGTGRAGHGGFEAHVPPGSEDRVLELDLQHDLGVGSLPACPAGRAGALVEKDVEQVPETPETEGVRAAGSRAPHGLRPEHVVTAPPLRVAQRLVGDRDLLEAGLGLSVVGVRIGVKLPGEPSVGALELVLGGVAGDAEQLVVVLGHRHASLTPQLG